MDGDVWALTMAIAALYKEAYLYYYQYSLPTKQGRTRLPLCLPWLLEGVLEGINEGVKWAP